MLVAGHFWGMKNRFDTNEKGTKQIGSSQSKNHREPALVTKMVSETSVEFWDFTSMGFHPKIKRCSPRCLFPWAHPAHGEWTCYLSIRSFWIQRNEYRNMSCCDVFVLSSKIPHFFSQGFYSQKHYYRRTALSEFFWGNAFKSSQIQQFFS